MGDNIRPAIYGAKYEAVLANRVLDEDSDLVTVCGKYCESGDVLISDILLPHARPGDLLAIPTSGAYCLAMSSQYNANPRPAVIMVRNGQGRLIRRRETYADMIAWDVD
jgi:diaminopimelate decarboxylase